MELTWMLVDDSNDPITGGAADTSLKIRRGSDGALYDFDDGEFKASGWGSLTQAFAEVDAVNLPGAYNLSVSHNLWQADTYQFIAVYSGDPRRVAVAEYVKTDELATWEIGWFILDGAVQFITGGALDTEVRVRRASDGYLLDWDDLTFKASGWVDLAPNLQEVDAVNVPGLYNRTLDISDWLDGVYQTFARYESGGLAREAQGEITVTDGYVEPAGIVYIGVPSGELEISLETSADLDVELSIADITVDLDND